MPEELGNLSNSQVGETLSWKEVWISAITQPSTATYERILQDPKSSANRAYGWVFISSLAGGAIGILISNIMPGESEIYPGFSHIASTLCLPVLAVISVIGLAISAGITQLVASALGGTGTYSKLVYAWAAYLAPLGFISSVIASIPLVNILGFPLVIYGMVLNVIAVKAVHQFGWGRAIASSVLILVGITVLVAVFVILVLVILGPAIGNVFSNIIQGLETPVP